MNVARVNMCNGDRDWHLGVICSVRRLNEEKGFAVVVIMDTDSSEIHVGDLAGAPSTKTERRSREEREEWDHEMQRRLEEIVRQNKEANRLVEEANRRAK